MIRKTWVRYIEFYDDNDEKIQEILDSVIKNEEKVNRKLKDIKMTSSIYNSDNSVIRMILIFEEQNE